MDDNDVQRRPVITSGPRIRSQRVVVIAGAAMGSLAIEEPPFGNGRGLRAPQTLNRFSYVSNNPANMTDPTGAICFSCITKIIETSEYVVKVISESAEGVASYAYVTASQYAAWAGEQIESGWEWVESAVEDGYEVSGEAAVAEAQGFVAVGGLILRCAEEAARFAAASLTVTIELEFDNWKPDGSPDIGPPPAALSPAQQELADATEALGSC